MAMSRWKMLEKKFRQLGDILTDWADENLPADDMAGDKKVDFGDDVHHELAVVAKKYGMQIADYVMAKRGEKFTLHATFNK